MHEDDDYYYCETDNYYYRYSDDLCYIEGHGYYRMDDDDIAYDTYRDEYAFIDDLTYIDSEDIYVSNTEGYACIEAGRHEGEYWDIDKIIYCEDVGYVVEDEDYEIVIFENGHEEYYYNYENFYNHSDGKWYDYPENEDDEDVA